MTLPDQRCQGSLISNLNPSTKVRSSSLRSHKRRRSVTQTDVLQETLPISGWSTRSNPALWPSGDLERVSCPSPMMSTDEIWWSKTLPSRWTKRKNPKLVPRGGRNIARWSFYQDALLQRFTPEELRHTSFCQFDCLLTHEMWIYPDNVLQVFWVVMETVRSITRHVAFMLKAQNSTARASVVLVQEKKYKSCLMTSDGETDVPVVSLLLYTTLTWCVIDSDPSNAHPLLSCLFHINGGFILYQRLALSYLSLTHTLH